MTPKTSFTEIILRPDSDLQHELHKEKIEQDEADKAIDQVIKSQIELP